ncbi:MAG: hypothetical protein IH620_00180 [Ignavibacterium sp.]|nr:hypothetical protein [Ignavibacterium sp.]
MSSIKIFLTLFILNSTFLIDTANAQWWIQGGNLIWPYGNVSVQKNLIVSDSIYLIKDGNMANFRLMSWEEEGVIINEPQLQIQTTESDNSDFGKLTMDKYGFVLSGYSGGAVTYSFSLAQNGRLTVFDAASSSSVTIEPNRKGIRLNNTVYIITGTGSPEGVVASPVGSLYLRSDGTAGNCLYIKESGSFGTGWVAK